MIYLLYKDRWERLKYQAEQCRKYIDDDITVVHGPYRRNPYDSKIKISIPETLSLFIKMEEIYDCNPSSASFRMIDLFNYCGKHNNSLVLKDDIVPFQPVDYDAFSQVSGSHSSTPRFIWTLDWFYSKEPFIIENRVLKRNITFDMPDEYNPFINNVEERPIETIKVENYLMQARKARNDITTPPELRAEIKRLSRCNCRNGELQQLWAEYLKSK